ncbi:MAG: TldD/PmbA family protein [Defluviitaleaceae bacterium]|nr:TldD/PmbA family protein [Defluviitaleaceae bacterium]
MASIKDKLAQAMAEAKRLGADYADIRLKDISMESVSVENGTLSAAVTNRSMGYGIRVYVDGSMGFAASGDMENMVKTVQEAYSIAKASLTLQAQKIKLAPKDPAQGKYHTPVKTDPFTVPFSDKLALLMECYNAIKATPGVGYNVVALDFRKDDVFYADTDTSFTEQYFCQCTCYVNTSATSATDNQSRSYVNVTRGGFETVLDQKMPEIATRLAKEVVELINAPDCPSGEFDLVINPNQLFLQIHESVGHPTELDRVLGSEAAFAGRSFLEPGDLDKNLMYGSELVTLVADATCEKGLGTFAFDDEGVPAQNVTLVDKGKFVGFQTSRDNAPVVGLPSSGAGLSDGWRNLPIVRMTNINLLPGTGTPEDLIAGVEYGFLLDQNKSWSIDDLRINFQFACQVAYEIKDGKLTGKMFKNPIYAGKTTEFWGSCDGIAGPEHWQLIGVPNCGKGQPMQLMRVSHGSSPARFRKVKVGVSDVK